MATERLFKSLRVLVMFSNAVWLGSVLVLEQHNCVLFSTAVSFCPILINSIKSEIHSAPPPAPPTSSPGSWPHNSQCDPQDGGQIVSCVTLSSRCIIPTLVDHHHRYLSLFLCLPLSFQRGWRIEHSAIISLWKDNVWRCHLARYGARRRERKGVSASLFFSISLLRSPFLLPSYRGAQSLFPVQ